MNEEEKNAIEKLTNGEKITLIELIRKMKREGIERFIVTRPEYVYIILNLTEKLQKEVEEKTTVLLAGAEKVKQLQKENSELKNKLDNSRKANEFLNTRNEELRKEKDVIYSKALNDIVAGIDLDEDHISKQEANEYKKEIEQLHEQIDKMNSFTNDTIKKYNKFITELELNQEFQNFAVMENKK